MNIIPILALATAPLTGTALLDDLQHRAVKFFWEQSEPSTGLTKDRAANFKTSDTYTVASVASTGFALAAYPIGIERKWLDRAEAKKRTLLTLKSINTIVPHEHGWAYHFIDWGTGERIWKCEASTIDTSILLGGMMAAEQYWKDPEITRLTDQFVKRIDWKWAMTDGGAKPNEDTIVMGWHPESQFIKGRWNTYDENKMLYVQAYGFSDVPTTGWKHVARDEQTYKGIDFIRGGPLFIHQMSESFFDFRGMRDALGFDYGIETRNATLANRQYCIDNPKGFKAYGKNFWGLSACDFPDGYNAFGAPGWTVDDGTITPTSPIASMPYTPAESLAFAEAMVRDFPASYGRYGFSNGVNPQRNWTGPDVIGIDLGMMLLGVENHRSGLIHKLTRSHPAVKRGYERIGFTKSTPGDQRLKAK